MVAAADTAVRKPIATQNNSSVRHQPVINDVAMTAVAQPLMMLTVAVADAATGLGRGRRPADCRRRRARDVARLGSSARPGGMKLVCGSGDAGNAPVGWRRMMPVVLARETLRMRRSVRAGSSGCRRMMRVSSDEGPPEVTGQPT